MSNFFDDIELTTKEEVKLKDFATYVNAQVRGLDLNVIPKLITDFMITGHIFNPITKAPLDIPYLPEKTGHAESDKENITFFLGSFFNKFNVDKKAKDYLKTALDTDRVKIVTESLKYKVGPSDMADLINTEINNEGSSTYTKYKAYTEALIVSESREKPKWYQFSKRIGQWRERRALDNMEKKLKSLGVKEVDIDNAKKKLPTSKEFFKTEPNFHDILKEAKNHFREADKLVDDDRKMSISNSKGEFYLKASMKGYMILEEYQYKPCDNNNPYEKKEYNELHKLLDNFDTKMEDNIVFDTKNIRKAKEDARFKINQSNNLKNNKSKIEISDKEFSNKIDDKEIDLENINEKHLEEEIEKTI